ncbi:Solute carrier family 2, facilitated glucose transporter member 3 [Trichinella patagoniensis]|uniref:Solute carrier family 2, facilitated glucose transporter member 3 n=1 Tax=Trichinella patagoniensis TaxID=990121 RepID=A0A0V1A5X2_9BILA|nr:Solute carrier family 2, facilitated glucose transporter member 3 [Trichinella patagoniensis]
MPALGATFSIALFFLFCGRLARRVAFLFLDGLGMKSVFSVIVCDEVEPVRLALLTRKLKKNMRNEETNEPNEQIPLTTDGSTSKVAEKAVPAFDDSALQGKLTRRLLFAVCASALGSSFVFGYNIGVMNSPELIIKKWMNETVSNTGASWTSSQIDAMWAMIVSMFPLGGLLGGMLSGIVSDRLGRRNGMLMNNIFAILAAGLFLTAKYASHYLLLLFGRMIVGINAGLSSALCPMYLTEISPVNLRGMLGSVNQLVVTISILVSQVLGISEILGRDDTWHILLFLTIVPAIFQLITLPHCPESPKYLLILKKRREDAEKALKLLREKDNVDAEIFALEEEAKQNSAAPKVRFSDMFKDKVLRWALFIAVMMMLSQQFSGINAVMFYSTRIFIDGADLTPDSARYATMGVGAINVIMTLVSTAIIDKAGRRTLHLLGLGGMWISCVTLTVSMILLKQGYNWSSYLCIAFVLIFVISFATGPGSIPWFFVSELFLQNARGHATSVAVPVNWGSAFIIGWIFPPMVRAIGEYSFLVFTGFLTIFWLFTFKYVPETKNRPVDDIVAELRRAVGVTQSRKWWWNLFNNALNIAVVAAWRLHCELHDADRSAMTHLAFRRDITAHLLRARSLQISRPGPRIHLPHSLQRSRGYFLQSSTQGLCADQLTCWLAFSIFAATFGCSFIFGYNIAVINTPQVIQQWINETLIEKNQTWTQSEMNSVWALIVGIFPFGGFIGGMLSGLVADKVGRRNGMLLNNIFAILAVSVMSVTQYTTSYICLIVGRFVIGINCGISSALCPMYLTEISPIKLRGMLDIIAIPAIFQLCSLPFCPESPKYLIAHGSNMEKVQKDLQKLRQVENVNSEIEAIQYEMNAVTATPKVLFLDMFRDRILRWALFISIMMMFSQQLSGINAVLFYSTKIFMDGAGLSEANAQFTTLGVGLINVLMTIVSAILIDKAGRRMLQLIGLGGMWISCIALSSIPWFYTNEIFLQNARGYANAIAASANWMSSFLVGWIFPLMANALEEYTFLVFVGTLAVFWLFTYKFVPETKNQKIEDVVAALKIPF